MTLWSQSETPEVGDPMYSDTAMTNVWFNVEQVTDDGEGNLTINYDFTRSNVADYHQDDIVCRLQSSVVGTTCVMNGYTTNTMTAKVDDVIAYSVSKENWVTASGTATVIDQYGQGTFDIYVSLEPTEDATATLYVNVSNSEDLTNLAISFTSTDAEATSTSNSMTAHIGESIEFTVTADDAETVTSKAVQLTDNDKYCYLTMRPTGTLYAYGNTWAEGIPEQYVYASTQTLEVNDNVTDDAGNVLGTVASAYSDSGIVTTISVQFTGEQETWGYDRNTFADVLPQAPTEAPTEEPTEEPTSEPTEQPGG